MRRIKLAAACLGVVPLVTFALPQIPISITAAQSPATQPSQNIQLQIIGQAGGIVVFTEGNAPATQPANEPAADNQPEIGPGEEVIQGGGIRLRVIQQPGGILVIPEDNMNAPATQPTTGPAAEAQPANPPAEEVIQGGGMRIRIIGEQQPDILVVPEDNLNAPTTKPTTGPAAEGQPVNPPAEEVIQGGGMRTGVPKRVRRLPPNREIQPAPAIAPANEPTTKPADGPSGQANPADGPIMHGEIPVMAPHPRMVLLLADDNAGAPDAPTAPLAADGSIPINRPVAYFKGQHVNMQRQGQIVRPMMIRGEPFDPPANQPANQPTTQPADGPAEENERPIPIDGPIRFDGRKRMPHHNQGPIVEPGDAAPSTQPAVGDGDQPATQPTTRQSAEERAKLREKLRRDMQFKSNGQMLPTTQPISDPDDGNAPPPARPLRPGAFRDRNHGAPHILEVEPNPNDPNAAAPSTQPTTQPADDDAPAPRPLRPGINRGGFKGQPRILVTPPAPKELNDDAPTTQPTTRPTDEERKKLREKLRQNMQFKSLDGAEMPKAHSSSGDVEPTDTPQPKN